MAVRPLSPPATKAGSSDDRLGTRSRKAVMDSARRVEAARRWKEGLLWPTPLDGVVFSAPPSPCCRPSGE